MDKVTTSCPWVTLSFVDILRRPLYSVTLLHYYGAVIRPNFRRAVRRSLDSAGLSKEEGVLELMSRKKPPINDGLAIRIRNVGRLMASYDGLYDTYGIE